MFWKFGLYFCNSFLIFGAYYFMELPVGLQNEVMNSDDSLVEFNKTLDHSNCRVCYGLGEVRYNMLFSIFRWTAAILCLPSGYLIDRLGNGRSAILFSLIPLLGSVLFSVALTSHVPITTPTYVLMAIGYGLLGFADGSLRFVKARVIAHCFPESTYIGLAFSSFGYSGQAISLYMTSYLSKVAGPVVAAWTATAACGFGVICAVCLTFLLQYHTPQTKDSGNKLMTLRDLRALPLTFWFYILSRSTGSPSWAVKQANLPDYLMIRHGYTMTEASQITGLSAFMTLLTPFTSILLSRIDCDGIISSVLLIWMVPIYTLLGFCPAVSVYLLAVLDGIGITIGGVMMWQVLLLLSPASHVGTLAGLMFFFRNVGAAVAFVISGYTLQRQGESEIAELLTSYQHFFIILVTLSSVAALCGVIMNLLDFQKGCSLNGRIKRWREYSDESMGLVSMMKPPINCSRANDINGGAMYEESPE